MPTCMVVSMTLMVAKSSSDDDDDDVDDKEEFLGLTLSKGIGETMCP